MRISRADITLNDTTVPTISSPPSSPMFASGEPVSGVQAITASFKDTGGGVTSTGIQVDGQTLSEVPVPNSTCRTPYRRLVPCPLIDVLGDRVERHALGRPPDEHLAPRPRCRVRRATSGRWRSAPRRAPWCSALGSPGRSRERSGLPSRSGAGTRAEAGPRACRARPSHDARPRPADLPEVHWFGARAAPKREKHRKPATNPLARARTSSDLRLVGPRGSNVCGWRTCSGRARNSGEVNAQTGLAFDESRALAAQLSKRSRCRWPVSQTVAPEPAGSLGARWPTSCRSQGQRPDRQEGRPMKRGTP